jgi:hypothetical protein
MLHMLHMQHMHHPHCRGTLAASLAVCNYSHHVAALVLGRLKDGIYVEKELLVPSLSA